MNSPYTPTWYQVEDSDALLEYQHGLLWSGAGTGKTLIALEAFRKGGYDKAVILCPKIALTMWAEECVKHLGLKNLQDVFVLRSNSFSQKKKLPIYQAKVLITTYDIAARDKQEKVWNFLHGHHIPDKWELQDPKGVLILDESQQIKNAFSKRTVNIIGKQVMKRFVEPMPLGIAKHFTDVWSLTGTPMMRYPDDLWPILYATRRDILAHYNVEKYNDFIDKFCVIQVKKFGNSRPQKVISGAKNVIELKALLKACMPIQRTLAEVVDDLPPVTARVIEVDYPKAEDLNVGGSINLSRLADELNNPDSMMSRVRRLLGVAKAPDVIEYVKSLHRPGYPILIGVWHRDVGTAIHEALKEVGTTASVHGGTPSKERDTIRDMFNVGKIDFLVGQISSMNASWNIQEACSHIVIAEEVTSPAMLHQFIARIHRKGQGNHVQVDYARTDHSLDIAMVNLRTYKADIAEELDL